MLADSSVVFLFLSLVVQVIRFTIASVNSMQTMTLIGTMIWHFEELTMMILTLIEIRHFQLDSVAFV